MSEKNDDGGPAFPRPYSHIENDGTGAAHERAHIGMSLRDYFAGQAMQGEMTAHGEAISEKSFGLLSIRAYKIADAMLESRKK